MQWSVASKNKKYIFIYSHLVLQVVPHFIIYVHIGPFDIVQRFHLCVRAGFDA